MLENLYFYLFQKGISVGIPVKFAIPTKASPQRAIKPPPPIQSRAGPTRKPIPNTPPVHNKLATDNMSDRQVETIIYFSLLSEIF